MNVGCASSIRSGWRTPCVSRSGVPCLVVVRARTVAGADHAVEPEFSQGWAGTTSRWTVRSALQPYNPTTSLDLAPDGFIVSLDATVVARLSLRRTSQTLRPISLLGLLAREHAAGVAAHQPDHHGYHGRDSDAKARRELDREEARCRTGRVVPVREEVIRHRGEKQRWNGNLMSEVGPSEPLHQFQSHALVEL